MITANFTHRSLLAALWIAMIATLAPTVAPLAADAQERTVIEGEDGTEYYPDCIKIQFKRATRVTPKDLVKAGLKIVCRPTNQGFPDGLFWHKIVLDVNGPGRLNYRKKFEIAGTRDDPWIIDPSPPIATLAATPGWWQVGYFYYGRGSQGVIPTFAYFNTYAILKPTIVHPN